MKCEIKPGQKVHHHCPVREMTEGVPGWETRIDVREVTVMAVSGKWAMLRRPPGCLPYVALVRELKPLPTPDPGT